MLTLALLLGLFAVALSSPPLALAVFALCASATEAFGVSHYLASQGLERFTWFASMPVLLGGLVAFRTIHRAPRDPANRRVLLLARILLFCLIWTGLSAAVASGPQAIGTISALVVEAGFPIALVALAYVRSRFARLLFVAVLAFQLTLAAGITLLPDSFLSELAASNSRELPAEGALVEEVYRGEIARFGLQGRLSAQYSGPGQYGLYSAIGIAVGSTFLFGSSKNRARLLGAGLLATGVLGTTVTVYRGTTAGLLVGFLLLGLIWVQASGTSHTRLRRTAPALLLFFMLAAVAYAAGAVDYILPGLSDLAEDRGLNLRGEALGNAISLAIQNPVFGTSTEAVESTRGSIGIQAHQIMVYYASTRGILVGLCVTFLLIVIVLATMNVINVARRGARGGPAPPELRDAPTWSLAILLGWICVGTSLMNNYTAPVAFWVCWAQAVTPWVFASTPSANSPSDGPRRGLRRA